MLGYFFFFFWNSGEEKKTLFKMLRSGYIAQFSPLDLYVLHNNFKIKFFSCIYRKQNRQVENTAGQIIMTILHINNEFITCRIYLKEQWVVRAEKSCLFPYLSPFCHPLIYSLVLISDVLWSGFHPRSPVFILVAIVPRQGREWQRQDALCLHLL